MAVAPGNGREYKTRMPPRAWHVGVLLFCVWCVGCGSSSKSTSTTPTPTPSAQSWADEFDGPANTLPDPAKWTYDLGNNNG